MATRMQQRRGTAAQWVSLNNGDGPVLAAGEIGYELDTNKFKIGDGVNHWIDLEYFVDVSRIIDSAPGTLDTLNELAAAIGDDANFLTTMNTNLATKAPLASPTFTGTATTNNLTVGGNLTVNGTTTVLNSTEVNVQNAFVFEGSTADNFETTLTLVDPSADRTISLPDQTGTIQLRVENVSDTEIGYLDGVTSAIQGQLNDKQPKITGVSDTELGYLDGVTGLIQQQLNDRLLVTDAASTYATKADPTFTGTVTLPAGTVTTGMIADGAVATIDIANLAVTEGKIADDAVTSAKILAGAVNTSEIADSAITTAKIAVDAVTNASIADNAVESLQLADNAVTEAKITAGSVSTLKIADASVTDAKLASDAVTTVKIADSAVTLAKIADGAIESSKIANLTIVDGDISATAAIALSKLATDPLDRANHTGTQAASTISDFNEAAQDAVGTILGTGLTYSDASNTITVDSTNVQLRVANVTDTEIGYLDGVTSAIQTQIDEKLTSSTAASTYATITNDNLKAPLASPALTGVPTAPTAAAATNTTQIATTAYVRGEVAALVNSAGSTLDTLGEIATALGNDANLSATLTTSIGLKAPLASPTFTGTVTLPAAGIVFSDGTQSKEGVPSRTPIIPKTASYELSALTERDSLIEIGSSSATTLTIPTHATVAYPTGTSIDILQTSTGQVTIAGAAGVTVNATPGLKLRAQWSSATLLKRADNTWVVYGDLSA